MKSAYFLARVREANTTHGETCSGPSVEYRAWVKMKSRCYNPRDIRYTCYGGRGITVCDRWKTSFENFLADMGRKPTSEHSLDRKDNDGNYELSNCRWATKTEQARNKRNNRVLTIGGISLTVSEWGERTGVSPFVIHHRLGRGWSDERAITPLVEWMSHEKRAEIQARYAAGGVRYVDLANEYGVSRSWIKKILAEGRLQKI